MEIDAAQEKAIAVANLNQLKYFVSIKGKRSGQAGQAYSELPDSGWQRNTVQDSLVAIGFSLSAFEAKDGKYPWDSEVNLHISGQGGGGPVTPKSGAFMIEQPEAKILFFSEKGVEKLLAAGVSSPTLDALKGKTSVLNPSNFKQNKPGTDNERA